LLDSNQITAMTTRLYALGSNSAGQLGIGHHEDVDVPKPCHFTAPQTLDPLSSEGLTAKSFDLRSPIRKIVAGGNHTIVLCDNGAVYAAGNREALGEVIDPGPNHATSDRQSLQDLATSFQRVMWWEGSELLDTFVDVSATWSASFFVVEPQIRNGYLARLGKIFVTGKGGKGELGLGENVIETAKPREVAVFGSEKPPDYEGTDSKNLPLILDVLAGIWSSVAYTVTCSTQGAQLFGWGNCGKGLLGLSAKKDRVVWEPRKVPIEDIEIDRIFMAAVGKDFTLLQGSHGRHGSRVRKWKLLGGNELMRDDRDDTKRFLAELTVHVPSTEVLCRGATPLASWSNIYVLESRTNRVKALGRNDYGQLPPKELPKVWTMAAGSEHCVGVTLQGRLVTWGWSEHGNCGRESDVTDQGWSVLTLPAPDTHTVAGVGAGCATTFIWTRGS
jgi:protein ATS1